MFISKETESRVIETFRHGRWSDSGHKMEYFFLFLMSKRMGISVNNPVRNTDFGASQGEIDLVLETLQMTTGLHDPTKVPGKRCSLDPFAFDNSGTGGKYKYFNQGTEWSSLPTRIPDTIDNTLRDYYIDRQTDEKGTRLFTLKRNYLDILTGPSFLDGRKINVFILAAWLYRFHDFGIVDTSEMSFLLYLRDLFYRDFKINEDEMKRLFQEEIIYIELSKDHVTAEQIIRKLPGLDPELRSLKIRTDRIIPSLNFNSYRFATGSETMNEKEIFEILQEWHQAILYGPPGTGKSYLAKKAGAIESNKQRVFDDVNIQTIQFHPSYSYEEFIGGVRWDPTNAKPVCKPGVLLTMCKNADQNTKKLYLLIIDEINRGNLSNIFGEAIMALDREYKLKLKTDLEVKDGVFFIPKNLYILGTMNSNDRSLALIDYALRRRFAFIRLDYSKKSLEDYYAQKGNPMIDYSGKSFNVIEFAEKLNGNVRRTLEPEMVLGQTYFMAPSGKWNISEFRRQYNCVLLPILEEYTFGKPDKLNEILQSLNQRFSSDADFFSEVQRYLLR